ncbi:DUF6891 domain-containing protein [Mariniluteicoccus flavus]
MTPRHAAFATPFPPTDPEETFASSLMLKVATGWDRDALESHITDLTVHDDMGAYFDEVLTEDEALTVLDDVIAAYRAAVTEPSADARALAAAFEALAARQIAVSFGEGWDKDEALDAGTATATAQRTGAVGCAYATTQDLDRLVFVDRLFLGFSSLGTDAASTEEVGRIVTETLREHGLPAEWSGNWSARIEVHPLVWEIPFAE